MFWVWLIVWIGIWIPFLFICYFMVICVSVFGLGLLNWFNLGVAFFVQFSCLLIFVIAAVWSILAFGFFCLECVEFVVSMDVFVVGFTCCRRFGWMFWFCCLRLLLVWFYWFLWAGLMFCIWFGCCWLILQLVLMCVVSFGLLVVLCLTLWLWC